MEKQIILPTQAFLEDIDSSDEELPEEHALDSRPHRSAKSFQMCHTSDHQLCFITFILLGKCITCIWVIYIIVKEKKQRSL